MALLEFYVQLWMWWLSKWGLQIMVFIVEAGSRKQHFQLAALS